MTPEYLTGAVSVAPGPTGKHIFTHREWHMDSLLAEMGSPELPDGWVWAGAEELAAVYAVPSAFDAFRPAVADRLRL